MEVFCTDAVTCLRARPSESVQCIICDPPFGIGEDDFDKHYARTTEHVIQGYQTAPSGAKAYEEWCLTWIKEIPRVLKKDGTLYIVCAWNHVCDVELAIRASGLQVLNHIIWKYNFGVWTQKKFVSSHYHILRCGTKPAFYPRAYFDESEKTASGGSAQYCDMEDVWSIPKDYQPGKQKNINKLPDALVEKMILYATQPGDTVADFFLGNFTTAYVSAHTGRKFVGCEINREAYEIHAPKVEALARGEGRAQKETAKPSNAGRPWTKEEREAVNKRYAELGETLKTKKEMVAQLQKEFKRGHFAILNVLDKPPKESPQ